MRNADPNARDAHQCTPLLLAAHYGHTSVVRRLVSSKVDITAVDASGKTALQVAVERQDPGT